jgi:ferritin-like metal-binding protein YciE
MNFYFTNINELRKFYINQLQILLSAEQQITEALPAMIGKATDPDLRQAFQLHLEETNEQIARLERILEKETGDAKPVRCNAAAALVEEAEEMTQHVSDESVRDAALIAAAQRVEHYEIAAYGAVRHFARILDENASAALLDRAFREKSYADHLLTEIAMRVSSYAGKAA